MSTQSVSIGTVISDGETPTFEHVRIKLRVGCDVKPGTLVSISAQRSEQTTLIARVRSAYEHNPNEGPQDINVRETLGIARNYPSEEDSTTIYRIIEADLIEEIVGDEMRSPQTLPKSGTEVYVADPEQTIFALGLEGDEQKGLYIGKTAGGSETKVILKREAIQRHIF